MRSRESINLKKPAIGLLLTHCYHEGKSKALRDFCRNSNMTAFKTWFWSQSRQAGAESLSAEVRADILKNELKGSNFTRFNLYQDKTLFGYSLDINWQDNQNTWRGGGAKQFGFVKFDVFNQNPQKHLMDAVVCSEITQEGRPARLIFDLDGSSENIAYGAEYIPETKEIWIEEFKNLLMQYFTSISQVLSKEEICVDARSCQKNKWSYHIVTPNHFVGCWKRDMPNVLRGILKFDKKGWFSGDALDFSLYGSWKVLGCVLSTKWKDLKKYVDNEVDSYRMFLPDTRYPAISSHLVHCYSQAQPEVIEIPVVSEETLCTTKKVGAHSKCNKIKISRKLSASLVRYSPGPIEFRKSRTLHSTTATELLSCIYSVQHHKIWDVVITSAYCTLILDDPQLSYQSGLTFYLKHISDNATKTPDGIRRSDTSRCKYQYNFFFKRQKIQYEIAKARGDLGRLVTKSYNTLLSFVNQTVTESTINKCLLDEAYGFPIHDSRTLTCCTQYIGEFLTPAQRKKITKKCVLIRSDCKTGKSTVILEILKEVKRIVYIISSQALANTVTKKLQEKGIDAINYQHLGDFFDITECDVIVTTIQSLHRLSGLDFEVCVLDELVSILKDCYCPKTNKKQKKNFLTLKGILRRTRAVRGIWGMDAHLTHNEVKFMEIWVSRHEICLIYNYFRPGKLGTPSQKAFIYPEPNHKKIKEGGESTLWYNAINNYVSKNTDLCQIYVSTSDDFKVVKANLCIDTKIIRLLSEKGLEEKFICLEILKFSGHLDPKHKQSVVITGKTNAEARRAGRDPFENLVQRVKYANVLLHNSALTCGCDLWIPEEESTYHTSFACCSWFIDTCQRVLQALGRIRNCKPGTQREIHITTKRRKSNTGPPRESKYPLGEKSCISYLAEQVPIYLRAYIENFDKKLFRVWARMQNQKALFVNMTEECWVWWLKDSNFSQYEVTTEGTSIIDWHSGASETLRPLTSIYDITNPADHYIDEVREGVVLKNPRNIQIYDKTAQVQKYVFTKHCVERSRSVNTFIKWLTKTLECKIPSHWKKLVKLDSWSIERFVNTCCGVTENLKDVCELVHEVQQRSLKVWNGQVVWKQGLLIFWEKFCDDRNNYDFDIFRGQWKIIELLRLRRAGVSCIESQVNKLIASRYNRKTLYGMLGDSNSHRLVLLSRCERETINTCFCTRLQLTPEEYEKCLKWCLKNMCEILKTFGALPNKAKLDNDYKKSRALFRKLLGCYGLKPFVCGSKIYAINLDVPAQSATVKEKGDFMEYTKKTYPELYRRSWRASLCNKLYSKAFRQQNFKAENITLKSIFVRKGQSPFRMYWSI